MDIQDIREQIAAEIRKLTKAYDALGGITGQKAGKRRKLSAEAREKIAAAQRKRWAKQKKAA
jgi:hypothetical protein